MKKLSLLILLTIGLFTFNSCEEDSLHTADYVSFEMDFTLPVDPAINTASEVKVFTTATSGSDRTFNISVDPDMSSLDPTAYSVPATVTIPANSNVGTFPLDIVGPNLGAGGDLYFSFDSTNSAFTGEALTVSVIPACFANEASLEMVFDSYPEETLWELYDASDNLVAQGGTYPGESSLIVDLCLESGAYSFIMYDTYGDGGGPFVLKSSDGTVLAESDGNYGGGALFSFSI